LASGGVVKTTRAKIKTVLSSIRGKKGNPQKKRGGRKWPVTGDLSGFMSRKDDRALREEVLKSLQNLQRMKKKMAADARERRIPAP